MKSDKTWRMDECRRCGYQGETNVLVIALASHKKESLGNETTHLMCRRHYCKTCLEFMVEEHLQLWMVEVEEYDDTT